MLRGAFLDGMVWECRFVVRRNEEKGARHSDILNSFLGVLYVNIFFGVSRQTIISDVLQDYEQLIYGMYIFVVVGGGFETRIEGHPKGRRTRGTLWKEFLRTW
jgi:hypothetical protein